MAIVFKIGSEIMSAMKSLGQVDKKAVKTYQNISKEAGKTNKEMKAANKNLLLAGGAAIGFFWGLAKVSGVLNTYMGVMKTVLGSIFDTLFISMMPMFTPLLEVLLDFGQWLRDSPPWVSQLLGALTLLIPVIWAFNVALTANPIEIGRAHV